LGKNRSYVTHHNTNYLYFIKSYKLLRYPAQGTGISSRGCWTSILSFILVIAVRVVLTYSLFADLALPWILMLSPCAEYLSSLTFDKI
jgi:hypothetical protein